MSASIFFHGSAPTVTHGSSLARFEVSPGKRLKGIQLQLQVQDKPTPDRCVDVILPPGFHYADHSIGRKVFQTDGNGIIKIQGLTCEASVPTGQYWLIAECEDAYASVEILVQAETIPLQGQAYQTVFNGDGSRAYVVSEIDGHNYIAIIDTTSRLVIANIERSNELSVIALSPDGKNLYAGDYFGRKLLVIDTQTLETVGEVALDGSPTHIAIHPGNGIAYISSAYFITVADLNSLKIVERINIGGVSNLAFNANGRAYALVLTHGKSRISIINSQNHQLVRELPLGGHSNTMTFSPDGLSLYAAIYARSETDYHSWIAVIDTLVDGFKNNIEHGLSIIDDIGISHDGKQLFGANYDTPVIHRIDIQSLKIERIYLGRDIKPYKISVNPTSNWIYGGDLGKPRVFALDAGTSLLK
jgi:DNA-binding beta-propeller fold protein YncE